MNKDWNLDEVIKNENKATKGPITPFEVNQILNSPCTHRLVYRVLALTDQCDIVDAIGDLEIVTEILKSKLRNTCLECGNPSSNHMSICSQSLYKEIT